ncbi:MAG: hypothetical protein ACK2T3_03320 [Candidatus Promineifilaceae bacterium]
MIACLSVPYFATAVERRDVNPSTSPKRDPGLILGGQPWEPRPVYGYSREAARLGVKPGMSLRLAHILSPEALFLASQPLKYLKASAEISDVLTGFTHLIEPEELWLYPNSGDQKRVNSLTGWNRAAGRSLPARFSVDLESLPSSEALSLVKEIGSAVRHETSLAPAIGLAGNSFTAHVAATLTHPNHARTILPEEASQFLASQTVHFLPLDKESARRLSLLGIRTMGQLAALPKSTLNAQFGSEFASIYKMAQGYINGTGLDAFAPLRPLAKEKRERIVHHFEEPISNLLILERVISRLAAQLAGTLQAAKMEARTMRLSMEVETSSRGPHPPFKTGLGHSGGTAEYADFSGIFTAAATRRYPTSALQRLEETLNELLHKAWEQRKKHGKNPADYGGALGLIIEIKDLSPAVSLQELLFSRMGDYSENSGAKERRLKSDRTVQNIATRHGREHFFQPVQCDLHHPLAERRFQMRGLAAG